MFDINFFIIGLVLVASLVLVMKYNAKQAEIQRRKG